MTLSGRISPTLTSRACGMFGHLTDDDVRRTIGYCAQLCAHGGTVIWTRERGEPDLVPRIRDWFAEDGFEPVWVSDPARAGGWARTVSRRTRSRSSVAPACSGSPGGPRR